MKLWNGWLENIRVMWGDSCTLSDLRALLDSYYLRITMNTVGQQFECGFYGDRIGRAASGMGLNPIAVPSPISAVRIVPTVELRAVLNLAPALPTPEQPTVYSRSPFYVESPLTLVLELSGRSDEQWLDDIRVVAYKIDFIPGCQYSDETFMQEIDLFAPA